jgi:KUP system potassium uptake protein
VPLLELSEILKARAPHRAPGTAIFLTSDPTMAPVALMHNLKHNKVLHEKNIVLTIAPPRRRGCARTTGSHRAGQRRLQEGDHRPTASWRARTCPKALGLCRKQG